MRPLKEITSRNFNHFCQRTTNYQKSQLRQDLFVLFVTDFKQNGYFIEAGASDGVTFSNTFTLEKNFNWQGILVEPGTYWKELLSKNRTCHIGYKALWKENESVLAICQADNSGSIKLLKKLAFELESTFKKEGHLMHRYTYQ